MGTHLPEYAAQPLRGFMAYWDQAVKLLDVSIQGISVMRAIPNAIEVLASLSPREGESPNDPEKHRASLEAAKAAAEFAEQEVKAGFPLLHAHTLVGVWGALEAAIEDMLVGILANEPAVLLNEAFSKLRISLADFEMLDKEERMRLLIEDIERGLGSSRKQGVDYFETLLDRFSLSGAVEEEVKRNIWEMNNIRNVIVHRASFADRRLVKNCPWMGLKVGDKVTVTHKSIHRYGSSVWAYVLGLIYRLGKRYDVDIDAKIQQELGQNSAQIPQQPTTLEDPSDL
jgi:hypothetical protein